jgi:hypothetical protein
VLISLLADALYRVAFVAAAWLFSSYQDLSWGPVLGSMGPEPASNRGRARSGEQGGQGSGEARSI